MNEGLTRRLFVGVFPSAAAAEHLGRTVDGLRVSQGDDAADRLTMREGWHLTVAFLGPVPVDRVADAASAVDRASVSDRGFAGLAGEAGLAVRLAGGGSFGGEDRQILWVGLAGDVAGVVRLAETVRRELTAVGLVGDGRELRPHLTITRPGRRVPADRVAADVRSLSGYDGPQWMVSELCLVESVQVDTDSGRRSRYLTLHRARLRSRPV